MSFGGPGIIPRSLISVLLLHIIGTHSQDSLQQPLMVTTTSCRTFQDDPPPPTQVTSKLDTPLPSPTTICATGTRAARVSLLAEPGVFVNVYDQWGTCSHYIQFAFDSNWRNYQFGAAYYDDPSASCGGSPTATISCNVGITGVLSLDETLRVAPTSPYGGRVDGSNGNAATITCSLA